MNCTETQLVSDLTSPDEGASAAILEQHLGTNYQQYYATFNQPTTDIALLQTPGGWGPVPGPYAYNGVGLSNSSASLMPFGFCLPGYLPASDATQPLPYDCEAGQSVCNSQTDFGCYDGVIMGGRLTASRNDPPHATSTNHHQQHQLQQPSWVAYQQPRLDTFDWRSFEDDGCECSAYQAQCIPNAVSSLSSSPSPSSLPSSNDAVMAVTSTPTSQCAWPASGSLTMTRQSPSKFTKQNENDSDGAFSPDGGPRGFPVFQRHGLSPPPRAIAPSPVSVRPEPGPVSPVQIRLQEASIESSFDDGDDESSPSPAAAAGISVFDRRRGSLGSRPGVGGGGAAGCDALNAGSRLGVVDDAANGVPSQARRSSIACIPATTRGLGASAAFHRPSAALDYESLKVKLEKLTGPVTEGTRKDGTVPSRALLDRRRTSIGVFPPHGYPPTTTTTMGPTASGPDDQRTTTVGGRDDSVFSADIESHPVVHAKPDTTGAMNTVHDCSQRRHSISPNHLQESTNSLEPYDKHLLSDDFSSSSSSSSSSSMTSSSCLLKFRLNCIIEQILQHDARLQEIVRRHESERQNVRRKHRFQWMELEKSLTRNFGDEWKKLVATIPELSLGSTSSPDHGNSSNDLHHNRNLTDVGQLNRQTDSTSGTALNHQNSTEQPLETITEGPIEDSFADVSTESSLNQRRLSVFSCDCVRPAAGSNSEMCSRRYSEGNMNYAKCLKSRPFRRVSKHHETPKIVQNNGELIDTRLCRNNNSTPDRLQTNRQSPVGSPAPNSSSRLHRYATDTTTSKTQNNTENSQLYGLFQPFQDHHRSCLQASITARLSQMCTQNALQALLTANLLDANNSTVYGYDPGVGLTGYGPNSFLPTGRPACAVQELDHQVLASPWTAPYQHQNVHSLLGLHRYEGYM